MHKRERHQRELAILWFTPLGECGCFSTKPGAGNFLVSHMSLPENIISYNMNYIPLIFQAHFQQTGLSGLELVPI